MTDKFDPAKLRELHEAATPENWRISGASLDGFRPIMAPGGVIVAMLSKLLPQHTNDAALIVALRNAVPAILAMADENAALKAEVARLRVAPVDAHEPTPTAVDDSAAVNVVVNGDLVEAVARAIAASDGLDFGEFCGVDADPDDGYCDSSTCVAAHWGEHDAEQARRWYLHLARAALTTASPLIRAQRDAEIAAWLREHAPQWGHEALADAIERGEVG